MNIKDWLKLNPFHKVTLSADGDDVRATLHGGDGIDQRLVGKGNNETKATENALETRALLVARLSGETTGTLNQESP